METESLADEFKGVKRDLNQIIGHFKEIYSGADETNIKC